MRISDWSSDVCSSDLHPCQALAFQQLDPAVLAAVVDVDHFGKADLCADDREAEGDVLHPRALAARPGKDMADQAARGTVQPEECHQLHLAAVEIRATERRRGVAGKGGDEREELGGGQYY